MLLNFNFQINLIKQSVAEQCELSIYKKIKLKMCDINAHSFKLIKCVK